MPIFKERLPLLIGIFYPWRRHIVWVTLGMFLISFLFSLLKKNYYQGKTIFYAASQDLFKPEKVFGNSPKEMYYYGNREDIDRIFAIGNSDEIIDFLIDSFDLWHVYKIKSGTQRDHFKLRNAVRDHYKILVTKQDALELIVEDVNPQRSAAMANAARRQIDVRVRSIMKNSQIEIASSYQRSINNKEEIMHSTLDSLVFYRRKSGIYDSKRQTKILSTRVTNVTNKIESEKATLEALENMPKLPKKFTDTLQLIKARISGLQRELNLLNNPSAGSMYSLTNFNGAKGKVEDLESRFARSYDQISFDLEKLKIYRASVDIEVSALHLVEPAEVPLYKSKPKRAIIVLASTIAAFFFSISAVMVIESYRQPNWKEVTAQKMNP